jgi:hypothetical protein
MQRANDLKQQMRHRLDQILHSRRYEEVLQEHYFAQREGRYVVPIKAEMQGRSPGIVHDVSSSGATVPWSGCWARVFRAIRPGIPSCVGGEARGRSASRL